MNVWWCATCGMEDTRAHDSCPTCASALMKANIEWLNDGEAGSETVFELEMLPQERAAIVEALMTNNIRHRWEGTGDLVVADTNVDDVDAILDEVLGEDEQEEGNDMGGNDGDGGDDLEDDMDIYIDADPHGTSSEDGYEVLSRLFLATGNILRGRSDADHVDDFNESASQVLITPTPFGVDAEMWADIQSTARNISVALQADSHASVDADLKGLHNLLQGLV